MAAASCESVLTLNDVMNRINNPINTIKHFEPLAFKQLDPSLGNIKSRAQFIPLAQQLLDRARA
jgi:hypothetical protein